MGNVTRAAAELHHFYQPSPRFSRREQQQDLRFTVQTSCCGKTLAVFAYRCRRSPIASPTASLLREGRRRLPLVTAYADRFTRFLRAIAKRVSCRLFPHVAVPAAVADDLRALPRSGAALRLRDYRRLDSRGASNNRSGTFAGDSSKVSRLSALATLAFDARRSISLCGKTTSGSPLFSRKVQGWKDRTQRAAGKTEAATARVSLPST